VQNIAANTFVIKKANHGLTIEANRRRILRLTSPSQISSQAAFLNIQAGFALKFSLALGPLTQRLSFSFSFQFFIHRRPRFQ
jgi:hypothetical protein